ncbi:hypothetical protein NLU13_2930 [Sarocladium strictum]|uniref:SWR1-complex protein 5 n=1 Tax=Sarocladium strictum TaxID=5046 RepID=A0AA39GL24_SARSR|nr:hypothetical protein NLU13_2930 [Sarocladium strictum]
MSADRMSVDDDDQYASSEDSDFAPDAANAAASDASDTDGEPDQSAPTSKKQGASKSKAAGVEEDAGYDNSGDEAIIERGRKRRKRAQDKGVEDDDEGGEGGLIKTRRQRAAEQEERKHTVVSGPVTIDVDAVWAQMLTGTTEPPRQQSNTQEVNTDNAAANGDTEATTTEAPPADPSALIRIKRTYNFAGRVHTEEKLVARDSAEAKLYFASKGLPVPTTAEEDTDSPSKRVARKAFRSAFEPAVTDPTLQRSDLNLSVAARTQAGKEAQQARKLNTVEKSRMDWAGFVDKEGIKDELELAGKSKDSYAAREDFLARSEFRREDEARRARLGVR